MNSSISIFSDQFPKWIQRLLKNRTSTPYGTRPSREDSVTDCLKLIGADYCLTLFLSIKHFYASSNRSNNTHIYCRYDFNSSTLCCTRNSNSSNSNLLIIIEVWLYLRYRKATTKPQGLKGAFARILTVRTLDDISDRTTLPASIISLNRSVFLIDIQRIMYFHRLLFQFSSYNIGYSVKWFLILLPEISYLSITNVRHKKCFV